MPKFILFYNNTRRKAYDLSDPVITIGRLPENSITLASLGVSRRHARIEKESSGVYRIIDLHSLNGTFVNGKKITRCGLQEGDSISIGRFNLLFDSPSDPVDGPNAHHGSNEMSSPGISSAPDPDESAKIAFTTTSNHFPILLEVNRHITFSLDKSRMTLGNSVSDDIFVDEKSIQARHVLIVNENDSFWIESLDRPVRVNGRRIRRQRLLHKDRIDLGATTFRYLCR